MKKCLQCSADIPYRVLIDDKYHILSSRKYCLVCSPFGKHNTRPFGYLAVTNTNRPCPICNKDYKSKGKCCGSCKSNVKRFESKERGIQYLGGKCVKCGYNKCNGALHFHHINPLEKSFDISANYCRNGETFRKELNKCQLLCANCHAEEHWNENSENREQTIKNYNQFFEKR